MKSWAVSPTYWLASVHCRTPAIFRLRAETIETLRVPGHAGYERSAASTSSPPCQT